MALDGSEESLIRGEQDQPPSLERQPDVVLIEITHGGNETRPSRSRGYYEYYTARRASSGTKQSQECKNGLRAIAYKLWPRRRPSTHFVIEGLYANHELPMALSLVLLGPSLVAVMPSGTGRAPSCSIRVAQGTVTVAKRWLYLYLEDARKPCLPDDLSTLTLNELL